ncbi:MAG: hypothetical protein Q4F42_06055 [Rikenellaceae bacterium]|nr:hypothetical protein [Rikenellaceae bacterium]
MIKKIIGLLFAVGVVAIIVMTALGAGSYRSLLPEDLFSPAAQTTAPVEEVVEQIGVEVEVEQNAQTQENVE